jgi:hypothetical protein
VQIERPAQSQPPRILRRVHLFDCDLKLKDNEDNFMRGHLVSLDSLAGSSSNTWERIRARQADCPHTNIFPLPVAQQ